MLLWTPGVGELVIAFFVFSIPFFLGYFIGSNRATKKHIKYLGDLNHKKQQ